MISSNQCFITCTSLFLFASLLLFLSHDVSAGHRPIHGKDFGPVPESTCTTFQDAYWCPTTLTCTVVVNNSAASLAHCQSQCSVPCSDFTNCQTCASNERNCGDCMFAGGIWSTKQNRCYPTYDECDEETRKFFKQQQGISRSSKKNSLGATETTTTTTPSDDISMAPYCIEDDQACDECDRYNKPATCLKYFPVAVAVLSVSFLFATLGSIWTVYNLTTRKVEEEEQRAVSRLPEPMQHQGGFSARGSSAFNNYSSGQYLLGGDSQNLNLSARESGAYSNNNNNYSGRNVSTRETANMNNNNNHLADGNPKGHHRLSVSQAGDFTVIDDLDADTLNNPNPHGVAAIIAKNERGESIAVVPDANKNISGRVVRGVPPKAAAARWGALKTAVILTSAGNQIPASPVLPGPTGNTAVFPETKSRVAPGTSPRTSAVTNNNIKIGVSPTKMQRLHSNDDDDDDDAQQQKKEEIFKPHTASATAQEFLLKQRGELSSARVGGVSPNESVGGRLLTSTSQTMSSGLGHQEGSKNTSEKHKRPKQ
jgi:hypothetical protein